ncbi:hypothetical protein LPAF129_18350 [Ligilactobacillus pabuli]|uniref:Uncharacterized protein n=1 Tax=Ligilactobacillus pabuli TaxID=2886039 RepID=A0ABQ5JJ47_9LACO|nr:hypothetical protein [Ligilactobacillus pabuli]GKS82149.1 hypothetical protein LPAF129_18350 [Ligilactobacillus pabuli]
MLFIEGQAIIAPPSIKAWCIVVLKGIALTNQEMGNSKKSYLVVDENTGIYSMWGI